MLGASSPIYLLARQPGTLPFPAAASPREYGRHWTPVHLDVVVEDLEAAMDRAVSAGASLESQIQESAWGRLVKMADPFGHGFCLLEFKGRGYDEIAEGSSQ